METTMNDMLFLIRQDSGDRLWLLNYTPSGCKEYLNDGKLTEFYTCLWGNRREDARQFITEVTAKAVAKIIGGCNVVSVRKGKRNEDQT